METGIPAFGDHVDAYMQSLVANGQIDSFEWIDSVTGSDHYMAVARGEQENLLACLTPPAP